MKKLISGLLTMSLVFALCGGLGIGAYAETDIRNFILNSFNGGNYVKSDFHEDQLNKLDEDKKVQRPNKSSYLDVVRSYYIDAPKGHSIYAYTKPDADAKKQPSAYHGSLVRAWAEQDGWACISYFTVDFDEVIGWVNADYLSSMPTADVISFGGKPLYSTSQIMYMVHPEQKLSSFNFVDSKTKYVTLSTPTYEADNFVAIDLYYKVVGRNGVKDASGERNVYINDGSGWEFMGSFEVNSDYDPVCININYDKPREIRAFAIVPSNSELEKCSVCQHVQWMYYPKQD